MSERETAQCVVDEELQSRLRRAVVRREWQQRLAQQAAAQEDEGGEKA